MGIKIKNPCSFSCEYLGYNKHKVLCCKKHNKTCGTIFVALDALVDCQEFKSKEKEKFKIIWKN